MTDGVILDDPFELGRFVDAQDGWYDAALAELRDGRKRTHWMWFVFPQYAGLGASPTARRFAIHSLDEAAAYVAHPLLGPRLEDCTRVVLGHGDRKLVEIFGPVDALKFRSSMTLFALVAGVESLYATALDQCCAGERDPMTLALTRDA